MTQPSSDFLQRLAALTDEAHEHGLTMLALVSDRADNGQVHEFSNAALHGQGAHSPGFMAMQVAVRTGADVAVVVAHDRPYNVLLVTNDYIDASRVLLQESNRRGPLGEVVMWHAKLGTPMSPPPASAPTQTEGPQ